MAESLITDLLRESSEVDLHSDETARETLRTQLSTELNNGLKHLLVHPNKEVTTEVQGVGVIPPPDKRQIVRRWLRREPTDADQFRKTTKTEVVTDTSAKELAGKQVQFAVVDFIDIYDVANDKVQQGKEAVIEWLGDLMASGQLPDLEEGKDEKVTIDTAGAVFYIASVNAFGQYARDEIQVRTATDLEAVRRAYATARQKYTEKMGDDRDPMTREITEVALGEMAVQSVEALKRPDMITVPIFMATDLAKSYQGGYIAVSTQEENSNFPIHKYPQVSTKMPKGETSV